MYQPQVLGLRTLNVYQVGSQVDSFNEPYFGTARLMCWVLHNYRKLQRYSGITR